MTFEETYGADHASFLGMDAGIAEALEALGLVATVRTRYVYLGKRDEEELRDAPIWEITAQPRPLKKPMTMTLEQTMETFA